MTEEDKVSSDGEVTELSGEADIEDLRKALADEKEKAEKHLANWQMAEADFSNYKRRAEQEKNELSNSANAALILNLLPILDDFERAFASLTSESVGNEWVDGFKLIQRKLQGVLDIQGVAEIKAIGAPFDPSVHEAVAHQAGEEGMVIGEVQRGYKLNDRVLRPTLVVVGKGEEEKVE